jgi:hypothetical protein
MKSGATAESYSALNTIGIDWTARIPHLNDDIQTLLGNRPHREVFVAVRAKQRRDRIAEIVGEVGRRAQTRRRDLSRNQSTRLDLLLATQNALLRRRRRRAAQRRVRQRLDRFQQRHPTHSDVERFQHITILSLLWLSHVIGENMSANIGRRRNVVAAVDARMRIQIEPLEVPIQIDLDVPHLVLCQPIALRKAFSTSIALKRLRAQAEW